MSRTNTDQIYDKAHNILWKRISLQRQRRKTIRIFEGTDEN